MWTACHASGVAGRNNDSIRNSPSPVPLPVETRHGIVHSRSAKQAVRRSSNLHERKVPHNHIAGGSSIRNGDHHIWKQFAAANTSRWTPITPERLNTIANFSKILMGSARAPSCPTPSGTNGHELALPPPRPICVYSPTRTCWRVYA